MGVQNLPVKSLVPTAIATAMPFRSFATCSTAKATDELSMPTIMPTFSRSYHCRAMADPMSALFWLSADRISMGRPRTLPPASSAAICAARNDPGPIASAYNPVMSVSTPTRMGLSCARLAVGASPMAAPEAARKVRRLRVRIAFSNLSCRFSGVGGRNPPPAAIAASFRRAPPMSVPKCLCCPDRSEAAGIRPYPNPTLPPMHRPATGSTPHPPPEPLPGRDAPQCRGRARRRCRRLPASYGRSVPRSAR